MISVQILLFILYVVAYTILPGLLVLKLCKIEFRHKTTTISAAFFLGMGILFVEYALLMQTGFLLPLFIINPVLTLLCILKIAASKNRPPINIKKIDPFFLVFIALVFAGSILTLPAGQFGFENAPQINIYQDYLWHMGNLNALSQNIPPIDPHVSNLPFYYHYFNEMYLAICKALFGVSASALKLSCTPFMMAFIFSFSTYSFIKEHVSAKQRSGLYCLPIFFAGMANIYFIFASGKTPWYLTHVLSNVNASGLGISAIMVLAVVLKYIFRSEKPFSSYHLFALALICLCTGIKGPFAIVCVSAFVLACVLNFIQNRKLYPGQLTAMAPLLAGFGVIYYFIVSGMNMDASTWTAPTQFDIGTSAVVRTTPFYDFFSNYLQDSRPLFLLIIFITAMAVLMGFSVPFALDTIIKIFRYFTGKIVEPTALFHTLAAMMGIVAALIINYSGSSNYYFLFAAIPFAQLCAIRFFEEYRFSKKAARIAVKCIFAAGMIYGIFSTTSYLSNQGASLYRTLNSENAASQSEYAGISKDEYEALRWIRDNTETDALIATNRHYLEAEAEMDMTGDYYLRQSRFFYYTAFSDRRFFIEGYSYSAITGNRESLLEYLAVNDALYSQDAAERHELAKANGIDYVIVSKRIDGGISFGTYGFALCYSNESVDIYEVE